MVDRAANGLANSRSTLITGIPASIALVATSVIAAPSKGSSTIASTPSLMKVSTWLICRFTSLVPSATIRSTSPSASASATADLVIEPIQPWSAAGAEKPMRIFSPVAAAEVPAADSPPALVAAAAVVAAADVVLDDRARRVGARRQHQRGRADDGEGAQHRRVRPERFGRLGGGTAGSTGHVVLLHFVVMVVRGWVERTTSDR